MQEEMNDDYYKSLVDKVKPECPFSDAQMRLLELMLNGAEVLRLEYTGHARYNVGLDIEEDELTHIELPYEELQELATSFFDKLKADGLLYFKNSARIDRAKDIVEAWNTQKNN